MSRAADYILNSGIVTLLASLAAYVLWAVVAVMNVVLLDGLSAPDMGALCMIFVLLGVLLIGIGMWMSAWADRKGNPYDRSRKARSRIR